MGRGTIHRVGPFGRRDQRRTSRPHAPRPRPGEAIAPLRCGRPRRGCGSARGEGPAVGRLQPLESSPSVSDTEASYCALSRYRPGAHTRNPPCGVRCRGAAGAEAVAGGVSPIVIVVVPDPIALGLITSLARPGGNITGLTSTAGPEIQGKRLELLRDLAPGAARIALLVNPGNPATRERVRATDAAARVFGVQVRVVDVRTRDELNGAFSMMKQHRIQALMVAADRLFNSVRVRLVERAAGPHAGDVRNARVR